MKLEKRAGRMRVKVEEETDPQQNYKPCVDVTFKTVGDTLGDRVLGIIKQRRNHLGAGRR